VTICAVKAKFGRAACLALAAAFLTTGCFGAERDPIPGDTVRQTFVEIAGDSVVHLAIGDTVRISATTAAFYGSRDMRAAWIGVKGPLKQGNALHTAIGNSLEDGLPPERYRHDVAVKLLAALENNGQAGLSDAQLDRYRADLDILLTEGFNRLARDLLLGMVDPAQAGIDHRIEQDSVPPGTLLNRVVAGEAPADILTSLRPTLPQYERMRAKLAAFRELESRGEWTAIEPDTTLSEGMRADAVSQLRQRLVNGVDTEEAALARVGAATPTLFDRDLVRAVQRFQDRHALEPDGVLGASTARELNHSAAEWIGELQLNLDRWRWLPRDLGDRYVLVNIAGFELEVVDNGQVIEAMDVVVGAEATATPIFADSIRHVVVNPYWNVPDGIMERTIEPAIARNPNYLRDNDMEVVDGQVRQRPGPKNALGKYKFIFPNEFDVYLHDTPDGHLFDETDRAFSSGCVRIERPRDFARMLLELQSSENPDTLDALVEAGEEKWIALERPLPIFLLYFTAWVREDGTTRFHHDVYGHDEAIEEETDEIGPPSRT
jgi:murein L,D-transpeptidase YcbB/YkuD